MVNASRNSVSQEDSLYVYAKLDSANGARIDGSLEKAKVWVEEAKTRSGELEWGKVANLLRVGFLR